MAHKLSSKEEKSLYEVCKNMAIAAGTYNRLMLSQTYLVAILMSGLVKENITIRELEQVKSEEILFYHDMNYAVNKFRTSIDETLPDNIRDHAFKNGLETMAKYKSRNNILSFKNNIIYFSA